ncbi:MAG: RnfABCDGE type electron transport complex subunit A [Pseudomonadota bacterium]
MAELAGILFGALIVNNFVLAQFLGLCPFMGVTQQRDTALAMSVATTFVLTLAAVLSYFMFHGLLVPLGLEWLDLIAFMITIAASVQLTELYLRGVSPLLHRALGVYLPLITSNCAVLAVALLAIRERLNLLETLIFAVGAALGFVLVMILFAELREKLDETRVPTALRGTPITLITAGLLSLGFLGFQGFGR